MENIVAIDTSAIIWDNNDFNNRKHHYYNLANGIKDLFGEIQNSNIKVLLRNELQNEMVNGFPFSQLPDNFSDVGNTFYSFFSKAAQKLISYPNIVTQNLSSRPDQVKDYYPENIKNEVKYLLSEMHTRDDNVSYISFEYLWSNNDNLKTNINEERKEHNTIIADKNNGLKNYIDSITPKFKHNSKHDCKQGNSKENWLQLEAHERRGFESWLSCFCNKNTEKPQELLDICYPELINNCYYSYDKENEVFVVFRRTRNNIFHAYDEYDINRIPDEVKEHFNKWKYKWYR